jgi:glycosyltransferase involved in cell wall biosynthesis
MIEAMACGTPVLAFGCGSVPEIIDDGLTGRIVSSVDEAVAALPAILALDRKAVRTRFEKRFSSGQMARQYVKLYQKLLHRPAAAKPGPVIAAHALGVNRHGRDAAAIPAGLEPS